MAWITGRQTVKHPQPASPTHFKQDRWTRTLFPWASFLLPPPWVSLYFVWLLLFIKIAQFRCRLLVFRHFLFGFIAGWVVAMVAWWHGGMVAWGMLSKTATRTEIFHANKWYFCWQLLQTPPAGLGSTKVKQPSGLSGLFILHLKTQSHTSWSWPGLKPFASLFLKIMPKIMQCHAYGCVRE